MNELPSLEELFRNYLPWNRLRS